MQEQQLLQSGTFTKLSRTDLVILVSAVLWLLFIVHESKEVLKQLKHLGKFLVISGLFSI